MGEYLHEKIQQVVTVYGKTPSEAIQGKVDSSKGSAESSPCPPGIQAEDSLHQIPRHLHRLHRANLLQMGKTLSKNQDETPYTEAGRQINFERTKKKRINARLDELYSDKSARAISYGKWGKLNNFEFIMNRAYALNRDKLKCRVCGG